MITINIFYKIYRFRWYESNLSQAVVEKPFIINIPTSSRNPTIWLWSTGSKALVKMKSKGHSLGCWMFVTVFGLLRRAILIPYSHTFRYQKLIWDSISPIKMSTEKSSTKRGVNLPILLYRSSRRNAIIFTRFQLNAWTIQRQNIPIYGAVLL